VFENGKALIVNSVAVDKTFGQIPKGYAQQSFKMDTFRITESIDLNFSSYKSGSNFVVSLDNGVFVLQNYVLHNFCFIVTMSVK
jgi:hypothetical protein